MELTSILERLKICLKPAAEIVKAVLRIDRILIAHSPHNAVVGKSANEPNLKG